MLQEIDEGVPLIVILLPQVHNCLIFPWLLLKSYLNLKVCKGGENFNLSQILLVCFNNWENIVEVSRSKRFQVYTEFTSIFQMDSVLNFQSLSCFMKYPVSMVNCFFLQLFCTFIHNKRDIYIYSANCHSLSFQTLRHISYFTMKVWVLVHRTSMNLKRFTLT